MTKPQALKLEAANIPPELRDIQRWVMWRNVEQQAANGTTTWAKVPFTVNGKYASSTNSNTWNNFDTVVDAYLEGGFSGIGLVLGADVQGIDLDDCRDPETGDLNDFANEVLNSVSGYAEVSPSGTGIKIFTISNLDRTRVNHNHGLELYCKDRYFTVTGSVIEGHTNLPSNSQDLSWLVSKVFNEELRSKITPTPDESELAFLHHKEPLDGWDLDRLINEVLPHLDPDSGYNDWLQVGQAMHHQGQGDHNWLEAWDEWSGNSNKYKTGECEFRWMSFSKQRYDGGVITLGTLIKRAKEERIRRDAQIPIERHPLLEFRDLKKAPSA